MISEIHDTIDKLVYYRERCIFCNSKLRIILTNSLGYNDLLPTLNSKYKEGNFEFFMTYNSTGVDLEANARLDTKRNYLLFDKPIKSAYHDSGIYKYKTVYEQAIWVFNKIAPHTESYCPSKKCGLNYYFNSNVFTASAIEESPSLISPVYLSAECFNLDNLWIQNDLVKYKTSIYSVKNPETQPIVTDMIDFSSMDKDKLFNKIRMLVTFS